MTHKKQTIVPFIRGELEWSQNCVPALFLFHKNIEEIEDKLVDWTQ